MDKILTQWENVKHDFFLSHWSRFFYHLQSKGFPKWGLVSGRFAFFQSCELISLLLELEREPLMYCLRLALFPLTPPHDFSASFWCSAIPERGCVSPTPQKWFPHYSLKPGLPKFRQNNKSSFVLLFCFVLMIRFNKHKITLSKASKHLLSISTLTGNLFWWRPHSTSF